MLRITHKLDIKKLLFCTCKKLTWCMLFPLVIIIVFKGLLTPNAIKVFSIDTEKGIYYVLNQVNGGSIFGIELIWLIFIICAIVFIFGLLFKLLDYWGKKLLIIKHLSLNSMNIQIDESELRNYCLHEFGLDQVGIYSQCDNSFADKITMVINQQQESVQKIKAFVKKSYDLGYVGIAHTPFIFMFGFKIGDENKVKLYHKRRDNQIDDFFHLLPDLSYTEKLRRKDCIPTTKSFDTILLCIETTFNISDEDISIIRCENDYILRYETTNKGFDVIVSSKQINEYVCQIKRELHILCQENGVKKVKICISSSVAFTFAFAQSFSINHDPEIVVYHYEKTNPVKYPWGINMTTMSAIVTTLD